MSLLHTLKLGDLSPTRDFNFVKDTARGFLALAECDETIGKEINIASNFEISMADTLNLIKEIMQSDVSFVTDEHITPNNIYPELVSTSSTTGRRSFPELVEGEKRT